MFEMRWSHSTPCMSAKPNQPCHWPLIGLIVRGRLFCTGLMISIELGHFSVQSKIHYLPGTSSCTLMKLPSKLNLDIARRCDDEVIVIPLQSGARHGYLNTQCFKVCEIIPAGSRMGYERR